MSRGHLGLCTFLKILDWFGLVHAAHRSQTFSSTHQHAGSGQSSSEMPVSCHASEEIQRQSRICRRETSGSSKHIVMQSHDKQRSCATEEVELFVNLIETTRSVSDAKIQKIKQESCKDPNLQAAMRFTKHGWPDRRQGVPGSVTDYFNARSQLSVTNDMLLYRDRIVIPFALRSEILDNIHEGHQGVTKCIERANMTVWWPGILKEIERKVATCEFCQIHRSSQRKEPLKPTTMPLRPCQKISADLFQIKQQHYLVVMDYHSRYLEIAHLPNISSATVIGKMKNMFARWGVPEEIVSDNDTQFTSADFQAFAMQYNFVCSFTSPHFPQTKDKQKVE